MTSKPDQADIEIVTVAGGYDSDTDDAPVNFEQYFSIRNTVDPVNTAFFNLDRSIQDIFSKNNSNNPKQLGSFQTWVYSALSDYNKGNLDKTAVEKKLTEWQNANTVISLGTIAFTAKGIATMALGLALLGSFPGLCLMGVGAFILSGVAAHCMWKKTKQISSDILDKIQEVASAFDVKNDGNDTSSDPSTNEQVIVGGNSNDLDSNQAPDNFEQYGNGADFLNDSDCEHDPRDFRHSDNDNIFFNINHQSLSTSELHEGNLNEGLTRGRSVSKRI